MAILFIFAIALLKNRGWKVKFGLFPKKFIFNQVFTKAVKSMIFCYIKGII